MASVLEGILGFFAFLVLLTIPLLLIDVIGRWTGTTFITRGGSKLGADQREMASRLAAERRINEAEYIGRIQERFQEQQRILNIFCNEFCNSKKTSSPKNSLSILYDELYPDHYLNDMNNAFAAKIKIMENNSINFVIEKYAELKKTAVNENMNIHEYYSNGRRILYTAIAKKMS